jgi:4-hydroxy-tetrahydrodipicolinate reductase
MTTQVAVVGATGKMGQLVSRIIGETDEFELFASLDSSSDLGDMIGADLVVDFTVPAVSKGVVDFAIANDINALVGTSGWSNERITGIRRALADKPELGVVFVPNFSIGSVLATSFAATAARFYGSIEIIEAHHASKLDSPSGTAVRTAELIGNARAALGPVIAPHSDQRARGQQVSSVPIHSLRMQGIVARQDVVFGGTGEVLTLTHETLSPESYVQGILLALRVAPQTKGVIVGLDKLIDLGPATAAE